MLDANRLVLDTIESRCDGTLEEDVVLEGRVIVEEGAVLARCLVRGPVIIGKRARSQTRSSGRTRRSRTTP